MKKINPGSEFENIFQSVPCAILVEDCSSLIGLDRKIRSLRIKNVNRFLSHHSDLLLHAFKEIKVLKANEASLKLYGANTKEKLEKHLYGSFFKKNLSAIISQFIALTNAQEHYTGEFKFKNFRGKACDIRIRFSIFPEQEKSLSKVLVVLEDITQEKKQERALMKMSQLDGLTGLLNHKAIVERLDQEFIRAKRYNLEFSCLMIDVDHFKWINDEFGHQRGDQMIKNVSHILRDTLRRSDVVGRYGGDEFFIILPETNPQNAVAAALRIQKYFYAQMGKYFKEQDRFKNALSIGISGYPFKRIKTSHDLITLADKMMYDAKTSGGNRILHPHMRSQRMRKG